MRGMIHWSLHLHTVVPRHDAWQSQQGTWHPCVVPAAWIAPFRTLPCAVPTSFPGIFAPFLRRSSPFCPLPSLFADMTDIIHKFFNVLNRQKACPPAKPAPQEPPKKGPVKRKAQSLPETGPKKPREYVQRGGKPPSSRTLEAWSAGRPWLRCDAVIGRHCATCFQHRDNVDVRGQGNGVRLAGQHLLHACPLQAFHLNYS